jgi:hypothetical protein
MDLEEINGHLLTLKLTNLCAISGFLRDVDEICALLRYYAALSGSSVSTFRDNLSFNSSTVKKSKNFLTFEDGTDMSIYCPETSEQNYHSRLRNIP